VSRITRGATLSQKRLGLPGHTCENFVDGRHVPHEPDCLAHEHTAFLRASFSHRRQIRRTRGLRHRAVLRFTTVPARDKCRVQYPSAEFFRPVITPGDVGGGLADRTVAAGCQGRPLVIGVN
jgi:hypothetical protein